MSHSRVQDRRASAKRSAVAPGAFASVLQDLATPALLELAFAAAFAVSQRRDAGV